MFDEVQLRADSGPCLHESRFAWRVVAGAFPRVRLPKRSPSLQAHDEARHVDPDRICVTVLGALDMGRPKVLFVVNVDTFFVSHRLPLGLALRDAGWEVVVAAGETRDGDNTASIVSGARKRIEDAGLRFVPLPLERTGRNPLRELRTVASLAALYRRERPDVLHHVSIKPVLYGSAVAQMLGFKRVINAISGLGYAFIDRPDDPIPAQIMRKGLRAAYRTLLRRESTRVIFQNPDDREFFIREGSVLRENTRLIRGSGVDLEMFPFSPMPEGPLDQRIVLMPSRLLWDKGIGEFVEASRILRDKGIRARFVVVGPFDPINPACASEKDVEGWTSSGLIEWWGPRQRTQMPEILAQAYVVVLPSYREGLPLVLAEASACGRPCITNDVPGCREVVSHGENGWLAKVRDAASLASAIEEALASPEEAARRGRRAREIAVERLSLSSVREATLAVYRELF